MVQRPWLQGLQMAGGSQTGRTVGGAGGKGSLDIPEALPTSRRQGFVLFGTFEHVYSLLDSGLGRAAVAGCLGGGNRLITQIGGATGCERAQDLTSVQAASTIRATMRCCAVPVALSGA